MSDYELNILFKVFIYIIVILSAVFHEYAHAFVANYLGDPTAKYEGRLTLNPLKHIDPLGTIFLPLFLLFAFGMFIGWAKPVPYNPYNLRDQKYGSLKVGISGPLANFFIALSLGLMLRFNAIPDFLLSAVVLIIYINIFLALFNLIPIPPLDGSKILMDLFPRSVILQTLEFSFIGVFIAVILAMKFLPFVASIIFYIITGKTF